MDSFDGNGKIDKAEFAEAMQDYCIDVTPAEKDAVFAYFDLNHDGHIDINEFIVGIRGKLNEARQPVVEAAYNKFDADGSGLIDINDIRGVYDASQHPKV
jgi:Ca2+-binding EF-hand superfamily protein